ncbi:hypothetical protein L248_1908 [Schleiferilactobacillus shenzhenensis LY-73]|uniref:Yip1 domain-containing protein n=2 Tax=Schleiferilactobacillus shenzhenensis TaxID=1231337 RepID=U4TLV1_9LACO|nr:hypothetical protein L248_1908 [Schleiferilactobacillus shenzhenensis LY-73]
MPPRTENPRVTHAKREASNYFANVLHSWLHPMDWAAGQGSERPYYGIVSLALLALLNTLVFWTVLQHAAQLFISILSKVITGTPMESAFKDFLNIAPSTLANVQTQFNTAVKTLDGNIYITFFLINVVALALFAGIGYAAKHFLMGDDQDFFSYVNQLGYYANGGLIIALVMLLLGMMGSLAGISFLFLMLLISTGLFNGAFFMATTQGSQKRFDKLYTVVIAQIVMNLIVLGLVGSQLAKIFSTLLNIK